MIQEKEIQKLVYKLISYPQERINLFRAIELNNKGDILISLPKKIQHKILNELTDDEITLILHHLDPDKSTDVLQILNNKRMDQIIKKLNANIKSKVEFLLKFNPKTAAGIMNLDYVLINKKLPIKEISKTIQIHEERTGKFPTILIEEGGILLGELPGHSVTLHKNKDISRYIKKLPTINYNSDEKDVISIFKKNPHHKIVVMDYDKSVMGIIYSDEILRLMEKQSGKNLYFFAGVHDEEDALDSPLSKVKHRYKWLILNLGTAFLAAAVVGLFQTTISKWILLAVYMPIVAGMGGNAGTQSLAVAIRGLALKEINPETSKILIMNETIAGFINGAIVGIIVAIASFFINHSPLLGLLIGSAMIFNLIVAGFFGAVVPLIMQRLGKDPASSASIFITTATDVLGFLVFLGLATLFI